MESLEVRGEGRVHSVGCWMSLEPFSQARSDRKSFQSLLHAVTMHAPHQLSEDHHFKNPSCFWVGTVAQWCHVQGPGFNIWHWNKTTRKSPRWLTGWKAFHLPYKASPYPLILNFHSNSQFKCRCDHINAKWLGLTLRFQIYIMSSSSWMTFNKLSPLSYKTSMIITHSPCRKS